jgi:hypothetical protein
MLRRADTVRRFSGAARQLRDPTRLMEGTILRGTLQTYWQ